MQEITFHKIVDAEALHQEMKTALGDDFIGVSVTGETVIIHVTDDLNPSQISKVSATVAAHNVTTLPPKPTPKSYDQRFSELEARLTALEQSSSDAGSL